MLQHRHTRTHIHTKPETIDCEQRGEKNEEMEKAMDSVAGIIYDLTLTSITLEFIFFSRIYLTATLIRSIACSTTCLHIFSQKNIYIFDATHDSSVIE